LRFGGDTDIYETWITMSKCQNKALNKNKNFYIMGVSTDLKKFTTKDKKTIKYFLSQIICNVNWTMFTDMINKKKSVWVRR
jgi:hypothetical protein